MKHEHKDHDCCIVDKKAEAHAGHSKSSWKVAAHATIHCLTGCVIGEVIGLMIGVSLGLAQYQTIILSTTLAYISGFALTIIPLITKTKLSFTSAFKAIWLGEVLSIGVMELVMNTVDYHMGGMRAGSVMTWQFWQALLYAVPAGFIAAYPVNAWLIGKQLKKCH